MIRIYFVQSNVKHDKLIVSLVIKKNNSGMLTEKKLSLFLNNNIGSAVENFVHMKLQTHVLYVVQFFTILKYFRLIFVKNITVRDLKK